MLQLVSCFSVCDSIGIALVWVFSIVLFFWGGEGSLDNSLAVLYTRTRIHLGYVVEAIPTVGSQSVNLSY